MIPKPVPREQGTVASEDGCRIAWYRYGDGDPAVVFFPTWNIVDARVVGYQVEYLAERCTVITYDARGSGASDTPAKGYDFPAHAADGMAVLDANALERVAVVTASRGINPAVLAAVAHPDRIDRLAAVAPYVELEPSADEAPGESLASDDELDWFSDRAWRTDWPGFARFFMTLCFTEPGSEPLIDELVDITLEASPEVMITQRAETDWSRVAPLLPQLACPTLFVHGDSDATLSVSEVEAIAGLVPSVDLRIIPGGGHRPDIRSPERVNGLLADFLLT